MKIMTMTPMLLIQEQSHFGLHFCTVTDVDICDKTVPKEMDFMVHF